MAADDTARAWDLMERIGIAMLVTRDGICLRARPMAAYVSRDESRVYFLTDARRHKDAEIASDPQVNLSFADAGDRKFVSLSGHAEVSNDRSKIRELFGTAAKAYWTDAEDPNIRVLKVTPEEAEFWDSDGKLVGTIKMAAAIATGSRPDLGDNRKVSM